MKITVKDVAALKERVVRSGYSLRGFGRAMGISSSYVVQICNGDRNPSPEVAKKMTDTLKCEFDDIFFIERAHKSEQKNTA